MFQNDKIAKRHGDQVEAAALKEGKSPAAARGLAAYAEKMRREQLDQWVKDNVGLN